MTSSASTICQRRSAEVIRAHWFGAGRPLVGHTSANGISMHDDVVFRKMVADAVRIPVHVWNSKAVEHGDAGVCEG